MKFQFVKQIDTTRFSIFYSLIKDSNNQIIGFGRNHYTKGRLIKKISLDDSFNVIEDSNVIMRGEDPRCFWFNDKMYVLDNYLNDSHLIEYPAMKYIPIKISGKNLSFIEHNNELYFIHYIKPFELYKFDPDTGNIINIPVNDDKNDYNYEFRGGTPGYYKSNNEYYGFGHRTYNSHGTLKHDIFKWVINFEGIPTIKIINVEQPIDSRNICDPTSVITVNDKNYLITAESNKAWFCNQEYITNVYQIID